MSSPTPSVFLHPSGSPRLAFASIKNQTLLKTRVSFLTNAKRRLPAVLSMTATEEGAVKSVLPGNGISIMVVLHSLSYGFGYCSVTLSLTLTGEWMYWQNGESCNQSS